MCQADFHLDSTVRQQTSGHPVNLTLGEYQTQAYLLLETLGGAYPSSFPECEPELSKLGELDFATDSPALVRANQNDEIKLVQILSSVTASSL